MTRQQQQLVFKPFFTTKQGGLGVGLALVKRIMERFEGSVELTSQEQEGTRVRLNFKVATGGEYGAQHICWSRMMNSSPRIFRPTWSARTSR